MPWRTDPEVRQWIMIVVGLAMGGLARWALLLRDKELFTLKVVLTDLMVMGVLALGAKWTVGRLGIEGETTALIAALFALSSDRIVRLMLTWFLASARKATRVEGETAELAARARARRSQPPVVRGEPPVSTAPVTDDDPEIGALIQRLDQQD